MQTPAQPAASNRFGPCTLSAVLSACMVSAALLSSAAAWAAGPAIAPSLTRQAIPPSVLAEIELRGRQIGLSNSQLQSLVSALRGMDMAQLRDLADVKNASKLERLLPGISAVSQPVVSDPSRPGGGAAGGSALQQGVQGQLTVGPGQMSTGRTGQLSVGSGCIACPNSGTTGGLSGQPAKQAGEEPKTINTAIGGTIKIYSDGSASIQNADGSTEYINSAGRIVDKNGAAAEPLPDGNARSNRITALDLIAIQARMGGNRTPNPNRDGGGTGGGVDAGKANPVGSRATFIESGGTPRVSLAQVREVIRIAVERLGGPIAGR